MLAYTGLGVQRGQTVGREESFLRVDPALTLSSFNPMPMSTQAEPLPIYRSNKMKAIACSLAQPPVTLVRAASVPSSARARVPAISPMGEHQ